MPYGGKGGVSFLVGTKIVAGLDFGEKLGSRLGLAEIKSFSLSGIDPLGTIERVKIR